MPRTGLTDPGTLSVLPPSLAGVRSGAADVGSWMSSTLSDADSLTARMPSFIGPTSARPILTMNAESHP